jgi:hypothetical protein
MERLRHCLRRRVAVALAMVCAGCSSPPASPTATPSTPSQRQPSATASATPSPSVVAQPVRVAVIVMENRAYQSVIGLPYISSLATPSTVLSNYHASGHPSLPNYLALTSGTTWGIADDGYHVLPEQDIGDQLTAAGVPWRAYMEGMGADCRQNGGRYAVKHDPFAYYGGRCPAAVVPFTHFATDLASASPPSFMWITPDLCNDMHDCSSAIGDAWLRRTVPAILASPAMSKGVVLITWDENDGGGSNQVLTLVLGARRPLAPSTAYSHPALLATVEDLLGLSRLPATAAVSAIALG